MGPSWMWHGKSGLSAGRSCGQALDVVEYLSASLPRETQTLMFHNLRIHNDALIYPSPLQLQLRRALSIVHFPC